MSLCQSFPGIKKSNTNSKIYLSPPHLSGKEQHFVNQALSSNWVAPKGPQLDQFERELETYFGDSHRALAVSSGTAAIHLGLKLLGVGPGDSVLTPTFSFCASANPIIYLGAEPIFIDCEPTTWGLNPELLEQALQEETKVGKKPKAIVVAHTYGMPADMGSIKKVAESFDIPVLEDSAESMGSTYAGELSGTIADVGVVSFNGNKVLTTGGGGALILKDDLQYDKALKWASQSKEQMPYDHHKELGYNYRMSNVNAAVGLGQFHGLSERINRKKEIFSEYQDLLKVDGITFHIGSDDVKSNRWLTTILIDRDKTGTTNFRLKQALEAEHIESRLVWQPLHTQPLYAEYPNYTSGIAAGLFQQGLCLPSGSALTASQIERISSVILSELKR